MDFSSIIKLMQLLGSGSKGEEPPQNWQSNAQICPFVTQNGIGQSISASDFEAEEKKQGQTQIFDILSQLQQGKSVQSALLEMLASQNKSNAMLPVILSMMQQKNQSENMAKSAQNADDKTADMQDKNKQNSGLDIQKQCKNENKTKAQQGDKFAPIAFAGYTLLSKLNLLLTQTSSSSTA